MATLDKEKTLGDMILSKRCFKLALPFNILIICKSAECTDIKIYPTLQTLYSLMCNVRRVQQYNYNNKRYILHISILGRFQKVYDILQSPMVWTKIVLGIKNTFDHYDNKRRLMYENKNMYHNKNRKRNKTFSSYDMIHGNIREKWCCTMVIPHHCHYCSHLFLRHIMMIVFSICK